VSKEIPYGTIGAVAVAGGGVLGAVYLGYRYFVEPGAIILAQYRYILTDMYQETKKFLDDNAKLDPPIYGLTAGQEEIIKAKESALDRIRPDVEKILDQRNLPVGAWVTEIITGILLIYGIKEILPIVLDKLRAWRDSPDSTNIQSSHGHSYILFEVITTEMAELGKLNIAGGFLSTMLVHYSTYVAPALNFGITYYNTLIPTLIPGTIAHMVATNMLTYMMTEVSATTGIMGALWTFWLPII